MAGLGDAGMTSNFASKAGDAVSESAAKSLAVVKHGAAVVDDSAAVSAKSAGAALSVAADFAGNDLVHLEGNCL